MAPILLLGGVLALLPPLWALETPTEDPQEQPASAADGENQEADGNEQPDVAPDALRDPFVSRIFKKRVLIDRPGFSVETKGKFQLQYLDADSDDSAVEDDLFIRRLRPALFGRIGQRWKWKVEAEINTEIEEGNIDLDQLDLRDTYLRYEGFDRHRLTFGNHKPPYSRDLMSPSGRLLLIERTLVGNRRAGVPDRTVGVHFRGETRKGKIAYWASVGQLGHDPGIEALEFETIIAGSDSLNTGPLFVGRLDFHPLGPMTYADGDSHTPEFKYTWSLAGYRWESDGNSNRFSEGGVSLDPERADLDSATGLEISGGLRGRGVTLDWQHNRIRGETVVPDFTGGIYVGGETRLDVSALEGGYRIPDSMAELGGALTRSDADSYADAWDRATAVVNLHVDRRVLQKLQIAHTWDFSRGGVPGEDFRETRVQLQYVW